jgi:hypothetical protein
VGEQRLARVEEFVLDHRGPFRRQRDLPLIPVVRQTLFGPRVTVFTKDGRIHTREGTGREFIWDFEEQARRIRPISDGIPIPDAQFAELIDTCRHLEGVEKAADRLIGLTIA